MATVAVERTPSKNDAGPWLAVLTGWHILVALAGLAGLFWVWQDQSESGSIWWRIGLTIPLLLGALGSTFAAFYIVQRGHRGRVASLVVNYLGLVVCFFGALNVVDVFTGIGALAGTFGRGLPFLIVAFSGGYIISLADRYENNPAQQRLFQQAGKIIALIGTVIFLYRIDTLSGLLAIAARFDSALPIGLGVGALLFGLMVWAMWRRPTAEALQANNAHGELLDGWFFLSPNLLGFLVFFAGPLLFSLYISFTDSDAFQAPNWIGLENYGRAFNISVATLESPDQRFNQVMDVRVYSELGRVGNTVIGVEDKLFWLALRNTLTVMLIIVPLSVIPALFLANLLNSKLPGMKFFRAIYFIPSIAAVVGIALIWQLLFNAAIGYINYGITSAVTFLNSLGLELLDPQVRWLSDSRTALVSVAIIVVWQTMGFNTVLFLAGLQQIPRDLYEAATVDGAGRWAQFWKITLPMLAPTTFFVVTTTTIQAMQLFDQIFILINPPAGPNNSTLTMVLYLYQQGFQRFNQGYASAIAWVLFILIFGVTLLQFQRQRAGAYES